MAASQALLRRTSLLSKPSTRQLPQFLRSNSTTTTPAHHEEHQRNHTYLKPSDYISSWVTPKTPIEAEAKLASLRREYAKKVKELRKEYWHEMELQRIEKQRKDEATREAIRVEREQRKALKAKEAEAKAKERKVAEEEFRQMLLKEREEKLENWRMKEKLRVEKMTEEKEVLHRKSSLWIDESELEKKILDAMVYAHH
ncbi:hypothetical protein RJ641_004800 [Dillenia turbinata]|uniref:Uncharacterized protein n=1 Tax=Dillenia turbinata TaxID=194707 RepID=A0AAN8ZA66_9MAGN